MYHEEFLEIIKTLSRYPRSYWLPYTDETEEGIFKNIFTNSNFNNSLFVEGYPKGGKQKNHLIWDTGLSGALDAEYDKYMHSLLCEPRLDAKPKSLKIRGLCLASQIDTSYVPTMSSVMSITWMGLGTRGFFIQYARGPRKLLLTARDSQVRAEINLRSSSYLVGRQEWKISNDAGCSTEQSYIKNISFR